MKRTHIEKILLFPFLITVGFSIKLVLSLNSFFYLDYHVYYNESRLFWSHINPITESVSGGAFPWTYLFNSLYVPPFLPEKIAKIYGICFLFAVYYLFIMFLYKTIKKSAFGKIGDSASFGLKDSILFALSSVGLSATIGWGNIGCMCCICVFLSLYFAKKRPVLSGLFMAFALMKPHTTGLLFFPLLLSGAYLSAFSAIALILMSLLFFCAYLGTDMLTPLLSLLQNGSDGTLHCESYGIGSFLIPLGLNAKFALLFSVAVSLIYAFTLYIYLKKHCVNNLFFLSVPFAVAVSFWFYKNMQDEYILLIPIGVICLLAVCSQYNRIKSWIVAIIILIMAFGISSGMIVENVLSILNIGQNISPLLFRSLTHFLVALSGIYICKEIVSDGTSLLSGASQEVMP